MNMKQGDYTAGDRFKAVPRDRLASAAQLAQQTNAN